MALPRSGLVEFAADEPLGVGRLPLSGCALACLLNSGDGGYRRSSICIVSIAWPSDLSPIYPPVEPSA
jgi:hypothetical protein